MSYSTRDTPLEKMRYLIKRNEIQSWFSALDQLSRNLIPLTKFFFKHSKCLIKIPENKWNFIKFSAIFLGGWISYFLNGIQFLDISTATDRKINAGCCFSNAEKTISENDWNFIKLQLFSGIFFRHLECFKIVFVSGIKFLDISSIIERKIRTGFIFSNNLISHFFQGGINAHGSELL